MDTFVHQAPGETGPKGTVTWVAAKLEPGSHEEFFTLGKCRWFWSHWRGRSVPCYEQFTKGAKECPHCGTRDYWQGYLPVCNDVGSRFLILVKEANKPVIDKLQTGQLILAAKKRGKGEPTTVRPGLKRQFRALTEMDEQALASIESALVVLWKDDFFKQWYAEHGNPQEAIKLALQAKMQVVKDKDALERAQLEALVARSRMHQKSDSDKAMSIGETPLPVLNGKSHGKR